MAKQCGSTLTELLIFLIYLAGIGGWVANIVKLIGTVNEPISGMFILRIVGILFPPLGCVLGFV